MNTETHLCSYDMYCSCRSNQSGVALFSQALYTCTPPFLCLLSLCPHNFSSSDMFPRSVPRFLALCPSRRLGTRCAPDWNLLCSDTSLIPTGPHIKRNEQWLLCKHPYMHRSLFVHANIKSVSLWLTCNSCHAYHAVSLSAALICFSSVSCWLHTKLLQNVKSALSVCCHECFSSYVPLTNLVWSHIWLTCLRVKRWPWLSWAQITQYSDEKSDFSCSGNSAGFILWSAEQRPVEDTICPSIVSSLLLWPLHLSPWRCSCVFSFES